MNKGKKEEGQVWHPSPVCRFATSRKRSPLLIERSGSSARTLLGAIMPVEAYERAHYRAVAVALAVADVLGGASCVGVCGTVAFRTVVSGTVLSAVVVSPSQVKLSVS
jgi:hypothetical protein